MIPRRFCIKSGGTTRENVPLQVVLAAERSCLPVQHKVPVNEAKINKIRAAFLGSPWKSTHKQTEIKHATIDNTQFCYLTSGLIQTPVAASCNSPRQNFSPHIMLCCSCKTERRRENIYSQKCVKWRNVFHLPAHVNRHYVRMWNSKNRMQWQNVRTRYSSKFSIFIAVPKQNIRFWPLSLAESTVTDDWWLV